MRLTSGGGGLTSGRIDLSSELRFGIFGVRRMYILMRVVVTSYKRRMTSWGQSTVGPRCLTSASKSLAPVDSGHISEDRHLIARGWWRQVCWWERLTAGGAGRRPGGERRMPCLPLHLTCSKLENRF